MRPIAPESFSRRILLAVSGMSPQILTETLYALARTRQPAWVPTQVHILTTADGAKHARMNLLQGQAHFLKLCADYALDRAIFDERHIHVLTGANGMPLADIRSVADNEAAADQIARLIRQFTDDEDAALHVSMAGGRKTMGYYAGYALSLFGRAQDRLSHVLVDEGFEGHRDFYYPTPYSLPIHREGKVTLDASQAQVTLAEIPFVRLRDDLPQKHLDRITSFAATIAQAQLGRQPQRLVLDFSQMRFAFAGIALDAIGDAELAFALWLLERKRDGEPALSGRLLDAHGKALGAALADFCQRLADAGSASGKFARLGKSEDALRRGMTLNDVQYRMSRLNKALRELLGGTLAAQIELKNIGRKGAPVYALGIDADAVEWVEHDGATASLAG